MDEKTPIALATLELTVDPQFDREPPTGALITCDGRRRAFSGWLELASVIEDWRQADRCENRVAPVPPTKKTTTHSD